MPQELAERRSLVTKKQEINSELERREKARREAMQQPSSAADDIGRAKGASTHTITEADIEEEQARSAARLHLD